MYTNPPPSNKREKIKYEAGRSIKMRVGGFTGTDDCYCIHSLVDNFPIRKVHM